MLTLASGRQNEARVLIAEPEAFTLRSSPKRKGGMHARITRLEASAEGLDEMTRQFEERTVPVLESLDGYTGYVLLGDRGSGLAMAVTYWESEEAMRASEDAVTDERERAAETAEAAAGPTVERYEVVSAS